MNIPDSVKVIFINRYSVVERFAMDPIDQDKILSCMNEAHSLSLPELAKKDARIKELEEEVKDCKKALIRSENKLNEFEP
jgi:hypothetical protein